MNSFIKKCLVGMFVIVLILSGVCLLSTKDKEVQASEASEYTTESYTYDQIKEYKQSDTKPAKVGADWIFAGWFTDKNCTTAYNVNTHTADGFAKFVPADVLSVKCQVTEGTEASSPTTNLRIVSTVDNLKYNKVGFDIYIGDNYYPYESKNVAQKIMARESGVEYGYSPNIFHLDSSRFITVTITDIPSTAFNDEIRIKPYWVTEDGTQVYGVSRYLKISDGYNDIINVPVRYYSGLEQEAEAIAVSYPTELVYDSMIVGDAFSEITVTDENGILTLTPTGTSQVQDGVYGYLRFTLAEGVTLDTLQTTNKFTVTKGSDTSTIVYKNYLTKYNGLSGDANNADTSWYSDTEDKFVIVSQTELYGLSVLSNTNGKTFSEDIIYLGGDIVANTDTTTHSWTPIGQQTSNAFVGTFNGQGHSITGLKYNGNAARVGFFGTAGKCVITDFSVFDSSFVTTSHPAGGVVGEVTGEMQLSKVFSEATVQGSNNSGGIVGRLTGTANNTVISECWFEGSVTVSANSVGGILGKNQTAKGIEISHCLNGGTVKTSTSSTGATHGRAGGICGDVASNSEVSIENCLTEGSVSGKNSGRMIGYVDSTNVDIDIINSYEKEDTLSSIAYQATVVSGVTIDGSAMPVSTSNLTGLLANKYTGLQFNDSSKDGLNDGIWVARYNDTPALRYFTDSYLYEPDQTALTETTKETINNVEYTVYTIKDAADLYAIAMQSQDTAEGVNNTFSNCIIRLDDDITINTSKSSTWGTKAPEYQWNPIGVNGATLKNFNGIFDGQGHTISGLYVDAVYNMAGLFGRTDTASQIRDFKLDNTYVTSTKNYAGSVVGYNSGIIEDIYSNTIVSAGKYVGGISGHNKGTVQTIYSDAIVAGTEGVGGIIGAVDTTQTISECWFDGSVTASTKYAGGIIGQMTTANITLNVKHCLNTGTIYSPNYVGGMIGYVNLANTVNIEDCLNKASISGNAYIAHMVGGIGGKTTLTASAIYGVDVVGTRGAVGQYNTAASTVGTITNVQDNVFAKKTIAQLTGFAANQYTELQFDDSTKAGENDGAWIARYNDTPALRCFVDNGLYVPDKTALTNTTTETIDGVAYTVYTIKDAADLYAIAMESTSNQFANSIVRLEADITVNDGDSDIWGTEAPKYQWSPIGTANKRFSGIFDGGLHTISGLYVNETTGNVGLFGRTNGTIRNLRLTNSHFETTGEWCGSIAGRANNAILSRVYSDADVVSAYNSVGGFIGMGSDRVDIDECWFAGTVTNASVSNRNTGGFVGIQYSGTLDMDNCLNTGILDVSAHTGTDFPMAGGFVGTVGYKSGETYNGANVEIAYCLNTGSKYIADSDKGHGAFTGYMQPNSTLNIAYTYVDASKWGSMGYYSLTNSDTTVNGSNVAEDIREMTGRAFLSHNKVSGADAMSYLAGFNDDIWTVSEDGTVVLKTFVAEAVDVVESTLQQMVGSNELLDAPTADASRITLNSASEAMVDLPQGGCIIGNHYYQALRTSEKATTARILKYNLGNGEKEYSNPLTLYHANDLTYNSKTGELIICHSVGDATKISAINPENITSITDGDLKTKDLGFNIYSIDYNATTNRYVVGESNGTSFSILNSDIERVYTFASQEDLRPANGKYTTQGITCDEKYIYCVLEEPDIIVVYDWFGQFISKIELNDSLSYISSSYEPENISIANDNIYVAVWNKSNQKDAYLYTIPTNTLTASVATE